MPATAGTALASPTFWQHWQAGSSPDPYAENRRPPESSDEGDRHRIAKQFARRQFRQLEALHAAGAQATLKLKNPTKRGESAPGVAEDPRKIAPSKSDFRF